METNKDEDAMVEEEVFVDQDALEKAFDPEGPAPPPEDGEEAAAEGKEGMVEFPDDSVQGFFDHGDDVFCVALHETLACSGGADDRAFLWDVTNGTRVAELLGHTDSVASVAFCHDGTLVATGGLDGVIRVWNREGGLEHTLEGPQGGVQWLRWHPRGKALVAGCEDCSVWIWLAGLGKMVAVLLGHAGPVECGTWADEGRAVVTGSDDCTVRIWKAKDGSCLHTLQGHAFHQSPVVQVAVSGQRVASGDADGGLFVSTLDGVIKGPLKGHEDSIECLAFSPQLPLLASGSLDGTLRVWDLATSSLRQSVKHEGGVLHLRWHATKQLLLAVCGTKLVLYEARTLQPLREWRGPTGIVNDVALDELWTRIVAAEDGNVCLVFSNTDEEEKKE